MKAMLSSVLVLLAAGTLASDASAQTRSDSSDQHAISRDAPPPDHVAAALNSSPETAGQRAPEVAGVSALRAAIVAIAIAGSSRK